MSGYNGGSAFPTASVVTPNGNMEWGSDGMSLRDYFAAKAMQGMLVDPNCSDFASVVEHAYVVADLMLKQREQMP